MRSSGSIAPVSGGALGGIEWGSAVDAEHAYFAVSDITHPQPGGSSRREARDGRAGLVCAADVRRSAAAGAGATRRNRRP